MKNSASHLYTAAALAAALLFSVAGQAQQAAFKPDFLIKITS